MTILNLCARGWRCRCEDNGVTTTEYAAMLAVIAGAAMVGLSMFGDGVHGLYLQLQAALTLS